MGCSQQILVSTTTTDGEWYKASKLRHQRDYAAAAVWNNTVIVAGSTYQPTNSVEQYDPVSNTCKEFPSMLVGRCYHALVNLNDTLYAIGGNAARWDNDRFINNRLLNEVEKFNAISNKWQAVSSLSTPRAGLTATTIQVSIINVRSNDLHITH